MFRKSMVVLSAVVVLSLFALAPRGAYAQATGEDQLIAKNVPVAASKSGESSDASPSPEVLQAQIRAQQMELNELRDHVKKLEAMLEAVAANQQARQTGGAQATATIASAVAPTRADLDRSASPSTAASSSAPKPYESPRELLPDIGQIGAQVGLLVGGSTNPFDISSGFFTGGYIDLPLKKVAGGKISYEILVSMQRATTTVKTTSGVIALVNSSLNTILGTPPSVNNLLGPLPVTNTAEERSTLLNVVPVAFKYTVTALDRYRFRPYLVAGLGTYVTLSTQNITDFDASKYVGKGATADLLNALLQGQQIGGLVPIAPELRGRGMAQGQGDNRFGVNFGGGVEFRISPRLSFGVDYRANKMEGSNAGPYHTFAFKQGIHF
jgi:opacity protein-like surface antigen